MAGTDQFYLGSPNLDDHQISHARLQALAECPFISASLSIASITTLSAVDISPGAIVYQVGLWNTGDAITGAELDVGDGTISDKYLDGITDIAANDIVIGGLGGAVGADPVGGAYYASGGTIALDVVGNVSGKTVKILVWYTFAS